MLNILSIFNWIELNFRVVFKNNLKGIFKYIMIFKNITNILRKSQLVFSFKIVKKIFYHFSSETSKVLENHRPMLLESQLQKHF